MTKRLQRLGNAIWQARFLYLLLIPGIVYYAVFYYVPMSGLALAFKKYNARDVEVELGIKARLAKFPVPDFVWDEYHLSEEINDRGIAIDSLVVNRAIEMDERSRAELIIFQTMQAVICIRRSPGCAPRSCVRRCCWLPR